jgi:hypothetical protein
MTTTDMGNHPLHDLYAQSRVQANPANAPVWGADAVLPVSAPVPDDPEVTTADVQDDVEGVPLDDTNSLEFKGRRFRLAQSIGLMPLLKFAYNAKQGLTSDDMEGLAAMYLLIRSCIDRSRPNEETPSEWELFEQYAIDTDADGEDLSGMINRAVQVISSRPPKRRGDSSPSSAPTSGSGKASSSSPGTRPAPPGFEDMVPVADLGR